MPPVFAYLGLLAAGIVVSFGTLWAFQRGAHDFSVFYQAWKLVISGHADEIYRNSPDRFLYAPGFAWLLAPLALLPREGTLALWCFAKAAVIGLMIRGLGVALPRLSLHERLGVAAWGFALLARPFLIDFQYGQVNTLILAACLWGLLNHVRNDSHSSRPWTDYLSWFALALAAITKLIALPLFLVPFLVTSGISIQKIRRERIGLLAGTGLILALPFLAGKSAGVDAYLAWRDALVSKGFPLESHNQSFAAFLHHAFSGDSIHVIAWGAERSLVLGRTLLSPSTLHSLSLAWTFSVMGLLLGWLLHSSKKPASVWISVLVGLLILPSHLVWKPYFVFGLPSAVLLMSRWRESLLAIGLLFFAVDLSGFDFLGHETGAWMEALSILLWAHLFLLGYVLKTKKSVTT